MRATGRPRLMLLDSASLFFRAFFGVPDRRTTPEAVPTNAISGFVDMIASLIGTHRPDALVACWDDDWRPAFRVTAIPSYKSHRLAADGDGTEEVPEALRPQIPVIAQVLAAVGLARVGCPGFEADDVIATLAARSMATHDVDIVTGDRDLFQLVDDNAGVRVLYTAKGGVRSPDQVTQDYLQQAYAVPSGAAYAELATLRGDPSDGLPGVSGIGEKTAATLLATFGDIRAIRQAAESGDRRLTPSRRERIIAASGYLDVASAVVEVRRDCPLPNIDASLPTSLADRAALDRLASDFGLAGPLGRLQEALALS